MVAGRPYQNDATLFDAAERAWWDLGRDDWLEAFAGHPRIGERGGDAWSQREQAGVDSAGAETRRRLVRDNEAYERRFGHVYVVCATGRSASELLSDLEGRLMNDATRELRVAAEEQAKITRLRLEKLTAS
jgi:OHCU decarboxylase